MPYFALTPELTLDYDERTTLTAMGANNPMTPRLAGRLGARVYKRWQVYTKPV